MSSSSLLLRSPTRTKSTQVFVENSDVLEDLIDAIEEDAKSPAVSKRSPFRSPVRSPIKSKTSPESSHLNLNHHSSSSSSPIKLSSSPKNKTPGKSSSTASSDLNNSNKLSPSQEELGLDASRIAFLQKIAYDDAMTKLVMQNSLQQKSKKVDEAFLTHLDSIISGKSFLTGIEKSLDMFEEAQKNKVRRQFEEWNAKVHCPIQQNIAKRVNAMDPKELNRTKCLDYQKFLNVVNAKSCIFRDIIIESEYDPLEVNKRAIVASVPLLDDPTNIDAMKMRRENALLDDDTKTSGGTKAGKHKAPNLFDRINDKELFKTREILQVELWESGKIESTPYGVAAKMMDPDGPAPQSNPNQTSHVFFNDFNFPTGKAVMDAEMPRGKRCGGGGVPLRSHSNISFDQSLPTPEIKNKLKTMQAKVTSVINPPTPDKATIVPIVASSPLSSFK